MAGNININVVKPIVDLIDELFTSDEERAAAKLRVLSLVSGDNQGQMTVNAVEAANKSLFVAGWRPFIGWTCGVALAYAYVLSPVIRAGAAYAFVYAGIDFDTTALPEPDLTAMMPVLLGMLGLGGLRTYEKLKGAA